MVFIDNLKFCGRLLSIFVSTCNVSYFNDLTVFVQKECLCSGYEGNADFGERGKLDYPEKISSGQGKEPGANEKEQTTAILSLCYGIFTDQSIFGIPFLLQKKR